MLRATFFVLLVFGLQSAHAQQVRPSGPPASILSSSPIGTAGPSINAPASILSPSVPLEARGRAFFNNNNFGHFTRFGNPHRHGNGFLPAVPIFVSPYPYYGGYGGYGGDYSTSPFDPNANDTAPADSGSDSGASADALRQAYNQGAQDALAAQQQADRRYGQHYLDSREGQARPSTEQDPPPKQQASNDTGAAKDANSSPDTGSTDDSPPAVFIFKDGHKLEMQNFAIVGQTLIDLSSKPPKRIQLADLDLDATRKANDDLGIGLKLP
jgi:hypothetical protein